MYISMDSLCIMFSKAFDCIEAEHVSVRPYHSLRVAALCAKIGRIEGFNDDATSALYTCALFHDNALTESALHQRTTGNNNVLLSSHCEVGQKNVDLLPLRKNVDGVILHHHSCDSGRGPFGVVDFPYEAAIIGACDMADVLFSLSTVTDLDKLRTNLQDLYGKFSTRRAIDALINVLDAETLASLRDENIANTAYTLCPPWEADMKNAEIIRMAKFIAHIIDCKSRFTKKHTEQIANRAWMMGDFYGMGEDEKTQLFLAASLHDIGKIKTPIDILEKPARLEKHEYAIIMQHIDHTQEWLAEVVGFGKIKNWAGQHHEKLDGRGYPQRLTAADLDFNSRLLACLDIYQAVYEERPYHPQRTHAETMAILNDMGDIIDTGIVKDLDAVMAPYSLVDIPAVSLRS